LLGSFILATNMKKIKKKAAKKTIKDAKKKLFSLKQKGEKIDRKEFEEYVKTLYKKNLDILLKE